MHPSIAPSSSTELRTPPIPELAPAGVFDAFAWCASDVVRWLRPATFDAGALSPLDDGANPPGLAFVVRDDAPAAVRDLPRELAHLHVPWLGTRDAWALAPYAIDDATDGLPAARVRPRDAFELATSTPAALVWGLHDWSHFHNHGAFERRAWTELQCDAAALVWLAVNAELTGFTPAIWERARADLARLSAARFASEGEAFPSELLAAPRLLAMATATAIASG